MLTLPAHQLRDLNKIAAGVFQHGDLGCGYVGWWHGEFGVARFHAVVISVKNMAAGWFCLKMAS